MGTAQEMVVVCPSCEKEVEPILRRLPGEADSKGRVGRALLAFANVCPVCAARLDATIEKAKRERTESEPVVAPIPETRSTPVHVPSTRSTKPKPNDEDLFDRIRREHEDVCCEEQELKARLAKVVERRETLDHLVGAMNGMQKQIAAE